MLCLLHVVLCNCAKAGKPVAVCDELAGDPRCTRLLLALGLTDFSLHPGNLLEVRREVRAADLGELRRQGRGLLRGDADALAQWLSGG